MKTSQNDASQARHARLPRASNNPATKATSRSRNTAARARFKMGASMLQGRLCTLPPSPIRCLVRVRVHLMCTSSVGVRPCAHSACVRSDGLIRARAACPSSQIFPPCSPPSFACSLARTCGCAWAWTRYRRRDRGSCRAACRAAGACLCCLRPRRLQQPPRRRRRPPRRRSRQHSTCCAWPQARGRAATHRRRSARACRTWRLPCPCAPAP